MSGGNKIKLQSSDNQIFEVDKLVACESQTLRLIIEDVDDLLVPIVLPSVSAKILSKVIQYCEHQVQAKKLSNEDKPTEEKPTEKEADEEEPHAEELDAENPIEVEEWGAYFMNYEEEPHAEEVDAEKPIEVEEWDADFMNVDRATLYDLINVANYLDIKPLLDLTSQTLANWINLMSEEELRNYFNI